ncbi:MAG: TlyA family RNA methyltransferase [Lachnospirales bacterium]
MRLDIYISCKQSVGRQRSKELIEGGKIYVNNKLIVKPSFKVNEDDVVEIKDEVYKKYVSRGGYKLEKAIEQFNIDFMEKCIIDVGASTGGFTHCAILNGARKVYAIDVGKNQLDSSLKNEKVISMEKCNILDLTINDIGSDFDIIVMDVSFVSIKKIIPHLRQFLKENGEIVYLIKPQFEAGKAYLNKKGVVKDKKIHEKIIKDIINLCESLGFREVDVCQSPITGQEGNIEYLLYGVL